MPERPVCVCHGKPMWRNGSNRGVRRFTCAVAEAARNKTRIRTNTALIGREHQFPAPREAVVAFVKNLKEAHGTHE